VFAIELRHLPVAFAELLVDQLVGLLGGRGCVLEGLDAALACATDSAKRTVISLSFTVISQNLLEEPSVR
jgi:hypothetical protein